MPHPHSHVENHQPEHPKVLSPVGNGGAQIALETGRPQTLVLCLPGVRHFSNGQETFHHSYLQSRTSSMYILQDLSSTWCPSLVSVEIISIITKNT